MAVSELKPVAQPLSGADASDAEIFTARDLLNRGLGALLKHRWLALLSAVVVVLTGVALTLTQEKEYTASTRIVIHPRAPRVLDEVKEVQQEVPGFGQAGLEKYYNTQHDIITGKAVARRVAERLELGSDPSYAGPEVDPETGERIPHERRLRSAVGRLRSSLTVMPSPMSQIFVISVEDTNPERAADLANAIAIEYQDYTRDLRRQLTEDTADWLEDQVVSQRKALEASEEAIQTFREEHGLETLSIAEWRNVTAEQVTRLQDQLAATEREVTRTSAAVQGLEDWTEEGRPAAEHPLVNEDPTVREIAAAVLQLERKIARDRERYLEKFPGQQADEQELALLKAQLEAEVARVVEGVRSAQTQAEEEARLVRSQLEGASGRALKGGALEVEYNRLRRLAETNATLYQQILRRARETEIATNIDASNINVLEPAEVPTRPSHPNVLLNLVVSFLAALFAAVVAAFILDMLDNTVKDPHELESVFHTRPLGILPQLGTDGHREVFVHKKPKSSAAECIRSVRTNLLFAGTQRPIRRILVTSGSPREGKTTLCANLAATMALAGHKVLVVDTDMRRPQMHRLFELGKGAGVTELLVGDCDLWEAVRETEISGLYVLPCGTPPPNPAELVGSNAFGVLLDRLQAEFDYVLLDSPPSLLVTDAAILGQRCDGAVLVVRTGQTEKRRLRETLRTMKAVDTELIGVVANGLDLTQRGYGYSSGYGYQYYRYYGEDEGEQVEGRRRRRKEA